MKTLAGLLILSLVLAAPAAAQHRDRDGGHYVHHWHPGGHWSPWGGFFGGVVGGTIGSLLRPQAAPLPVPEAYVIRPYSAEWYAYCARKYQSFDATSGSYLGFDGLRHPCQ